MIEVAMAAKHTLGPWTVQALEHSFRVVDSRALKFSNSRLCDVQHWSGATRGPDRAEAHANASLMAAAPDLLAALESFAMWAEQQAGAQSKGGHATFDLMMLREQRDIALAAIAKAEGGAA